MRLAELVADVYHRFDVDAAMADVAEVARHDRYQASAGIEAAAAAVAERAESAGLRDVAVLTFPADGARRWWTYHAPVAWTPLRARLILDGEALVSYPEEPYTLAAYSAHTPPGGLPARLMRWSRVRDGSDPAGALVVLDDARVALPTVAARLEAAGALAVAADPLGTRDDRAPDQVGRLELLPGAGMAAFSVCGARLARLVAGADAGASATVEVQIDTGARGLPVVTGSTMDSDEEVWLTAHLCHPRPSANDNASGVAALLGAARVLADRPRGGPGPAVRFVWGPEFVGLAAYLHDIVHTGQSPVPSMALNVDMAGPDPHRCGGPLVIERGPDELPSFLSALAERCAALLPPTARSHSGAVPSDPWTWRSAPFAGGSDHALLVDAPTRCPTVSFGHWPDRTNHSSADTLDVVSPAELRRTSAIVTSVVAALRRRTDPDLSDDIAEATASWAVDHVLDALPGRRPPLRIPDGGPVLDPHDDARVRDRVAHRGAVALGAIGSLGAAGVPGERVDGLVGWVGSMLSATTARFDPVPARPDPPPVWPDPVDPGPVLARCWPGPINLRALAEAATPADRAWWEARLAEDRGGNYARAVALLRGVDGHRDRRAVAWWAAFASELPMPVAFADRLLDLLFRAGWAAGPPTVERGC